MSKESEISIISISESVNPYFISIPDQLRSLLPQTNFDISKLIHQFFQLKKGDYLT